MATISESNGRASVFLGAVSAGLIALGFESTRGAGPVGRMIFQVLVLTPLVFLGLVAFARCLEIAIDDWEFVTRITRLQCTYDQLVPELAPLMSQAVADDGLVAMLSPMWQPFQKMLSVAVITSVVVGGDAGVIVFWVSRLLYLAIAVGAAARSARPGMGELVSVAPLVSGVPAAVQRRPPGRAARADERPLPRAGAAKNELAGMLRSKGIAGRHGSLAAGSRVQ